ncbi:MAG TPA: nucleotidyltransferase family protein [Bryobacteraceae bacterium]|nr:nucleotidyltransferase family protein [Bryobacteraceae bacterium]
MKIGLILLAAGNSTRMGSPKQLVDYRGKTLLRHAVETALASVCQPVVVVLGANADAIRPSITELPVEIVVNDRWEEGMGTSIHSGVSLAMARDLDGIILALADQPLVSAEFYDRLIAEHRVSGKPIVTSEYAGTVGVPVFFASSHFSKLLALAPDQGCKGIILSHGTDALRIACPEAGIDIDTPLDLERVLRT